jgi:glycosyltransferase involved in cell wall biosynthesis
MGCIQSSGSSEASDLLGVRVDARMLGHSGIGVVIENVVSRWIQNHPNCNFQVLINISKSQSPDWLIAKNVEVALWQAPIYSITEQYRTIPAASFPINITWCPHYNLSLALGPEVVTTIHDVFHLDRQAQKRNLLQTLYAQIMFRWVGKRSRGITFVSEFSRKEYFRLVGIPRCPTQVIWNGVDDDWFHPSKSPVTQHGKPYILFVGNAFVHKNLSRLINAIKIVRDTIDIDLIIVGKIAGLKNLDGNALNIAKENADFVKVIGRVPPLELKNWMANASALAFPSIYEGFGLPPLEALACGIPVMVSDIPVHRELYLGIANFSDPFSVESIANGLRRSLSDTVSPECRRNFARYFDWANSSEEYFQFLVDSTKRKKANK